MMFLADSTGADLINLVRENMFWSIMGVIALTGIVTSAIKSVVSSNSRERSRREIAAYIAEGSMTPEQGERLMNAGDKRSC